MGLFTIMLVIATLSTVWQVMMGQLMMMVLLLLLLKMMMWQRKLKVMLLT